ncbi:Zinc finger, SWIM-type [Melia azedarach]|uniref:Zinc finger, SWIM-type n=1 Tax=Melia azedarach TaxID=155640 RepID=A0ACC1XH16_MELAZ|nr:Zinc finger, SWIM-type [Melia azedarach]
MAAADGLFRCIYEGCISGYDTGIERRPYHRNCGCALHTKSGSGNRHPPGLPQCKKNVSYPMRRSYSEGSLVLASYSSSYSSLYSSPSSSPKIQLGSICNEEDDNNINLSFKV